MTTTHHFKNWLSAWFWFPIHTAHWKFWRHTIAQLRSTRCRFRELGLSLELTGDERDKQIALDIRKILELKY